MNTKTYAFNWQDFERNFVVSKYLPVMAVHTDTGRITSIILKKMETVYVTNILLDNTSNNSTCIYNFNLRSTNFGESSGTFTTSLPTTKEALGAALRTYIITLSFSLWGITITDNDVILENTIYVPATVTSRSFSNPSLAVNTARQASTTRDAFVSASVDITANLTLITGQRGTVTLQYADNSGFTTNVRTAQASTNGNTGTLTVGLALGQTVSAAVSGIIPAGKFYRILTTNNTGTPTYGTPVVQEVLL